MAIATWSRRFETGLGMIDAQHRALFEAVNRLAEAYQSGEAHARVQESLEFLVRYTWEHFQDEEQVMRESGFPGLSAHSEEHSRLLQEVHKLQAQQAAGRLVTMELTIFLADWLSRHIESTDMQYVDFLRNKGASQAIPATGTGEF